MENLLKRKMETGQKAVGTFFEIGGSNAVECLGVSGLDFFIIDSEHGPFGRRARRIWYALPACAGSPRLPGSRTAQGPRC